MEAMEKVMTALVVPLMLLNMFGGIVSGIWLAVLGEWGVIGWGILYLFAASFLLGFAMLPGLIFAAPIAAMGDRANKFVVYICAFFSALYTMAVITAWCIWTLYFFATKADSSSYIPVLIWSYGAATGPLVFLAKKDMQAGNDAAMTATFFAQLAYVLVAVLAIFFPFTILELALVFGGIMVVGLIFQFIAVIAEDKQRGYI